MGEYLRDLIKDKNWKILEFGTGTGRATEILAEGAESVITMDASAEYMGHTVERLTHLNNIQYCLGYEPFEADVDMVFIDGPRGGKARREALIKWWPHLKEGTLFVMDDATRDADATLVEWQKLWGITYEVLPVARGIGIFRK